MPGAAEDDALPDCSAPTAKTLSMRAVWVEPHCGHGTNWSCWLMLRTSRSNLLLQLLQVYS
jgi:hypothetical protein